MRQQSSSSTSTGPAVVGIILSTFGAVILAVCSYWGYSEHRLLKEGAHAMAAVVAVQRDEDAYFPIFRFRDARNTSFEVRSHTSSRQYKPGDSVPVVYNPVSPLVAEIDEGLMNYLGPVIFGGLGMLLFSAGALTWIFRRRFNARGEFVFGEGKQRESDTN